MNSNFVDFFRCVNAGESLINLTLSTSGKEVIKLFSCSTQLSMKFFHANKSQITNNCNFFLAKSS